MAERGVGQLCADGPQDIVTPVGSPYFKLVSSNGLSNFWSFVEPLPSSATVSGASPFPAQGADICIKLSAPIKLSPVDAYMHFARIKDTTGLKHAQYQKYYGTESSFLQSVNLRFGTCHSFGVLKGWLKLAKDKRRLKKKGSMSVKILEIEALGAATGVEEQEWLRTR